MSTTKIDPQDLRDSVRDFRAPSTLEWERDEIRRWWASLPLHVPNQFAAMLRAGEIERDEEARR